MNGRNEAPFVGCCMAELLDRGVKFPMIVLYPTTTPAETAMIGPYPLNVALDAAPDVSADKRRPLVLLSHGSGGSPILYRTLAFRLARGGFVVGMPEHPGNNQRDNTLHGTIENLIARPRHISAALNWFSESEWFRSTLRSGRVPIIGHSMGGYTALAVAGGIPTALPHEAPSGFAHIITGTRDSRVGSLVLLAPATIWYRSEGALSEIEAPILMLFGNRDDLTPPGIHAKIVLNGVRNREKVRCHIVENAGHFSFLSPFPPYMSNNTFLPSQDPPGFDRRSFLDKLHVEILNFLTQKGT